MIIDHLLWEPSLSCRRRMASDGSETQVLRYSDTQVILQTDTHLTQLGVLFGIVQITQPIVHNLGDFFHCSRQE